MKHTYFIFMYLYISFVLFPSTFISSFLAPCSHFCPLCLFMAFAPVSVLPYAPSNFISISLLFVMFFLFLSEIQPALTAYVLGVHYFFSELLRFCLIIFLHQGDCLIRFLNP